jgi:hypothetical protein
MSSDSLDGVWISKLPWADLLTVSTFAGGFREMADGAMPA